MRIRVDRPLGGQEAVQVRVRYLPINDPALTQAAFFLEAETQNRLLADAVLSGSMSASTRFSRTVSDRYPAKLLP